MANLVPITGVDGYIALLNGTSTVSLAEACSQITSFPGGADVYPAKQIYQITARSHKIIDPRVTPVVYVGGVSQPITNYVIYPGAGLIFFRTPLTGTPVVTIDIAYIPTASATDVIGVQHVNNWQLALTGNQIQGDEYGKSIVPEYRGKMSGTWSFDRMGASSGIDLFNRMIYQNYFIFALYESLAATRLWVVYGDLTGAPIGAPGNGMVAGQITGTLREVPSFLNEAL